MALVKSNKGFSLVEVMVGVAFLGIAAMAVMNISKNEGEGVKRVEVKEFSSYIMKEIMIVLENRGLCQSILGGKSNGGNVSFLSTDGTVLQAGTKYKDKVQIKNINVSVVTSPSLPAGQAMVGIRYTLSSLDDKFNTSDRVGILGRMSGSSISGCISPREDGEALIQQKAIQIAKDKVCREDLNGTMNASGTCNWTEPVNYQYITIQL